MALLTREESLLSHWLPVAADRLSVRGRGDVTGCGRARRAGHDDFDFLLVEVRAQAGLRFRFGPADGHRLIRGVCT